MSEENNMAYNSKKAIPNKLIQRDGTIVDIMGNEVISTSDIYDNIPALPNKLLNPDGSYSTLSEIIGGAVSGDLFVIVDELPATGENNKIYLLTVQDKLVEYIWVNNDWDPIGMVEFDLTNYYNKTETDDNFLKKSNTTAFTPSTDYNPATKKYVDDCIATSVTQVLSQGY